MFVHINFVRRAFFVFCVSSILIFLCRCYQLLGLHSADSLSSIVSYYNYYYYYYYYYFVSTITRGIYNYMPETNHVSQPPVQWVPGLSRG